MLTPDQIQQAEQAAYNMRERCPECGHLVKSAQVCMAFHRMRRRVDELKLRGTFIENSQPETKENV